VPYISGDELRTGIAVVKQVRVTVEFVAEISEIEKEVRAYTRSAGP
jgi:hypothetical protein